MSVATLPVRSYTPTMSSSTTYQHVNQQALHQSSYAPMNPWIPCSTTSIENNNRQAVPSIEPSHQPQISHSTHPIVNSLTRFDTTQYRPQKTSPYATKFEYVALLTFLEERLEQLDEPLIVTKQTCSAKIAEETLQAGVRIPGEHATTGGVPILFDRVISRFGDGKRETVSWDQLIRDDEMTNMHAQLSDSEDESI